MYTSDKNEIIHYADSMLHDAFIFLAAGILSAVFGLIYEIFSHEVYSFYMIYAFLILLVPGALLNLLIVWMLTALWHGITPNYLIWGGVLAVLIIWEKFVVDGLISSFPIIGHLHVWLFIPLTWVIFAITDLKELRIYFERLFPFFGSGVNVNTGDFMKQILIYWPFLLVSLLLCTPHWYRLIVRNRRRLPVILILAAVFWFSVYRIVLAASNPFMYFSF